ncbi:unnamed protein product [Lepidochelys olivacea]
MDAAEGHRQISALTWQDPVEGHCSPYPADWIQVVGPTYAEREVVPSEAAYHGIQALFHVTMLEDDVLLTTTYRIHNEYLWGKIQQTENDVPRTPRGGGETAAVAVSLLCFLSRSLLDEL